MRTLPLALASILFGCPRVEAPRPAGGTGRALATPTAIGAPATPIDPVDPRVPRVAGPPSTPTCTLPVAGPAPSAGKIVGTDHPIWITATSKERRWATFCQARADTDQNGKLEVSFGRHGDAHGDQLLPYLVVNRAKGEPIDAYVSHDPRGRFVTVIQHEHLVLIDAASDTRTILEAADISAGDPTFGPHRAAAFSPDGQRMLYLTAAPDTIVVRELSNCSETKFLAGSGLLVSARFDTDGNVIVTKVEDDTNGNGTLDPPYVPTSLSPRHCRGEVTSYTVWTPSGDEPVHYRIEGAKAVRVTTPSTVTLHGAPSGPRLLCLPGDDGNWVAPVGPCIFL